MQPAVPTVEMGEVAVRLSPRACDTEKGAEDGIRQLLNRKCYGYTYLYNLYLLLLFLYDSWYNADCS